MGLEASLLLPEALPCSLFSRLILLIVLALLAGASVDVLKFIS